MKAPVKPFTPVASARLSALGERLRLARLRRKFSSETVSARASISRMTLYRIESGDPTVAFGHYVRVLIALQLDSGLDLLAVDDVLGKRLQDLAIPARRRAPKRRSAGDQE